MDLPVSWNINRDLILSKRKNLLALLHPDRAEAPKDAEAHFQTVSNSSKTLLHDVSRAKHLLDLGWGLKLLAEGGNGETLVDPAEMLEIMEVADQIPSLDAASLASLKQEWSRRHLAETERTHSKIQHLIDVTARHVKNLELLPGVKDDAAITSAVDAIEVSAGRMQFVNRILEACAKRERQIEGIEVD
ncbi:MAG: uncharacterized protein KVP18_002164 [Porospora cf. gigantea A]|nr:MAG: hypothetical protein KVP18_002164 [Porospora cf. gigantea A]